MQEKMKFEVLTTDVTNYLQKLSYSDSRISQYHSAWQRVSNFMKANGLQYFTATVGEEFIYYLLKLRTCKSAFAP